MHNFNLYNKLVNKKRIYIVEGFVMKRKSVSIGLAALLAVSLLAGCGGKGAAETGSTGDTKAVQRRIIPEMQKQQGAVPANRSLLIFRPGIQGKGRLLMR